MSKYYKAFDVERIIKLVYAESEGKCLAIISFVLGEILNLPTIDIIEYADKDQAYMEGYAKGVVYGGLSKSEVSEDNKAYTYCSRCGMRVVVDAPSVVPSRAEGEWIEEVGDCEGKSVRYICSQCCDDDGWINYNYCPNCGAKMKGESE